MTVSARRQRFAPLDDRFVFPESAVAAGDREALRSSVFEVEERTTGAERTLKLWRKVGGNLDQDLRELWRHEMRQVTRIMWERWTRSRATRPISWSCRWSATTRAQAAAKPAGVTQVTVTYGGPKVRITRLLSEVARRTGFTDRFTELRSGKIHPNPSAVLAAVLADGTNLGLERMADSSQGVTYAQLAWTQAWYLSEETYAAALACIVDAQAALPLSRVWGDGTTSSSDGQFFRSGRRGAAGAINAKYGADPGQKIYTWVSDQYAPFHNQLISATAAEAPHVLDGLLHHGSSLDIQEHYTDTAGATDHVFALCHLLGYRFVPRIRDLADRRLGTFEPAARYKELEPLIGRPINTSIIRESWDEVVRLAASLKAKTVAPSVMLKKLSAYKRQNRLDFALQEIGRVERALFTLDWLESKDLRRRCLAGLNKSESRHALAAAVFTQRQGRMTNRTVESQEFRASGLNLVTAAIVYWNTLYMGRAVDHLRAGGHTAPDHLLAHRAPLGWTHISLTGDYLWREPAAGDEAFMPLRTNERFSSVA
jgi:TnpA family transposase